MIHNAIARAYQTMKDRNWETIYWAIDLHGTCLKSNYQSYNFKFVNQDCIDTLKYLRSLPETKIIIWSSCYEKDYELVKQLFDEHGITIDFFNENPLVQSTRTGNFVDKFYFSILLDDKAGFSPETDWHNVKIHTHANRLQNGLKNVDNLSAD